MAIAKVGSAVSFNSGTTNVSSTTGQTLSITPTPGNTIVVWAAGRTSTGTITIAAVGGTASFTSEVAEASASGSQKVFCQVAVNVGSGITGVKITPSSSMVMEIWVQEYSGVDNTTPMDVTPTVAQESSTTLTSASITPVTNGALILGGLGTAANEATTTPFHATSNGSVSAASGSKPGTGWTSEYDRWNQGSTNTSISLVVASNGCNDTTGAYQSSWSMAVTSASGLGTIALRPAATGARDPSGDFFAAA